MCTCIHFISVSVANLHGPVTLRCVELHKLTQLQPSASSWMSGTHLLSADSSVPSPQPLIMNSLNMESEMLWQSVLSLLLSDYEIVFLK